jgi:hypothetical protein
MMQRAKSDAVSCFVRTRFSGDRNYMNGIHKLKLNTARGTSFPVCAKDSAAKVRGAVSTGDLRQNDLPHGILYRTNFRIGYSMIASSAIML